MKVDLIRGQFPDHFVALTTLMVSSLILIINVILLAQDIFTPGSANTNNYSRNIGNGTELTLSDNLETLIGALENNCSMVLLFPREGIAALSPDCQGTDSSPELEDSQDGMIIRPFVEEASKNQRALLL